MFKTVIENKVNEMSGIITKVFKRDIVALLGEDARSEDIEIINKYFDDGHAVNAAKEELKKNNII